MSKKKPTYGEAVAEIDEILNEIEDENEVDIDLLASKVERAAELLELCNSTLHNAELRVRKITDKLTRQEANPNGDTDNALDGE